MTTCLDRLQLWLREQHVAYSIQHHRQTLSAPDVATALHANGDRVARTVIAQVDGRLVMLVVPAAEHVDLRRIVKLLGVRTAVIASDGECERYFPDCQPGAVPPFGSLFDMPTYLDEGLTQTRKLVFLAGTHHDTLKLATGDFLRLAEPITGHLTYQPATVEA